MKKLPHIFVVSLAALWVTLLGLGASAQSPATLQAVLNPPCTAITQASAQLLCGEAQGLAFDFTVGTGLGSVTVKDATTAANALFNRPVDELLAQSGTSPKEEYWSDGLYRWSPHNLFTRSEEVDHADWTKASATVSANATAGPTGAVTADKLIEAAASAQHYAVNGSYSGVAGFTYTWSQSAKAAERTWMWVEFYGGFSAGTAYVNLATGAIGATTGIGSGLTVTAEAGGWYRLQLVNAVATLSGAMNVALYTSTGDGVNNYLGDGTSGIYLTRAQINRGTTALAYHVTTSAAWFGVPIEYDPTTAKFYALVEPAATNVLVQSRAFGTTWSPTAAVVASDQTTGPDGTIVADKLTADTANNVHTVVQSFTFAATTTYTFSIFLKYSTSQYVSLRIYDGVTFPHVTFDVLNGTKTNTEAGISGTITAVGGGLYRMTVTMTTGGGAGAGNVGVFLANSSAYSGASYVGAGTEAVFMSDAQLELGAVATSPIPTFAATVTRSADNITVASSAFPNSIVGTWAATFWLRENAASNHYILSRTNADAPFLYTRSVGDVATAHDAATVLSAIGSPTVGAWQRATAAYDGVGTQKISLNGGAVASGSYTPPATSNVAIGERGNFADSQLNGRLGKLLFVPRTMTNAQMPAALQ